jgi:hypothetical protein
MNSKLNDTFIGVWALTAVSRRNTVFRVVTPCALETVRCFKAQADFLLAPASFLFGLLFTLKMEWVCSEK